MKEPVHATSRRYDGIEVQIPTFAPLPRITVLDWAKIVLAQTAVAFDISQLRYDVFEPRNVLFEPSRLIKEALFHAKLPIDELFDPMPL